MAAEHEKTSLEDQFELVLVEVRRLNRRVAELEARLDEQVRRIDALEQERRVTLTDLPGVKPEPLTPLVPALKDARVQRTDKTYGCAECGNRIFGAWDKCPHCGGGIVER